MKINKKSCRNYFILLCLVLLMIITINTIIKSEKLSIDLFGEVFVTDNKILVKENNEYYLSYSFVKKNIDKEIHFDKVSKKIIISTDTSYIKAKINDKNITNNLSEEELLNNGVIEKDDKYISAELLKKAYNFGIDISKNTMYIYENNSFGCSLKTNRVRINKYGNNKSRTVEYASKKDNIVGLCEYDKYVLVKINNSIVGYIQKNMLNYEAQDVGKKNNNTEKCTYVFADNTDRYISYDLKFNGVFINMFDINKISGDITVNKTNSKFITDSKSKAVKVYGIVTNGYNLTSFNRSITSQILSDEEARTKLIKDLIIEMQTYNLDGLAIDFKMIKETDKDNYMQFIKEFNSLNNKEMILIIDANDYKNYYEAINYSDFAVINMFGLRDLNSNVAGSISDLNWMKNILNEILKTADNNKIVACIPLYSILWTEKNSNVINAEIYSLSAIEDYISKNNLSKKYNENVGQNYIELKKGSLLYRMWVEDSLSIENRINYIKDTDIKGVAVYKFGYENKSSIDIINRVK